MQKFISFLIGNTAIPLDNSLNGLFGNNCCLLPGS